MSRNRGEYVGNNASNVKVELDGEVVDVNGYDAAMTYREGYLCSEEGVKPLELTIKLTIDPRSPDSDTVRANAIEMKDSIWSGRDELVQALLSQGRI